MKKRLLNGILLGTAATLCAGGFAACKGSDGNNGGAEKTQIEEVYESYVAYAEENGTTPLSYEEWLASIKGEKGERGEKGEAGSAGKDGKDGINGVDGKDGQDGVNGKDGKDGERGEKGEKGEDGKDGANGVDGKDGTNGKDGVNGKDGKDGTDGKNGVSVIGATIDENGNLILTLSDGSTLNAGQVAAPNKINENNKIIFNDLEVSGKTVKGKVSNATESIDFYDFIETKGFADFRVFADKNGQNEYITKSAELKEGDNLFYVMETCGKASNLYELTIRRLPIYTVTFDSAGGTPCAAQRVEEGSFAEAPETTRAGYGFDGWGHDFEEPIAGDTTLTAQWKAIYALSGKKIIGVTEYGRTLTELVVPDVIDGVNVTAIGESAFESFEKLESIEISEGIKTVEQAFSYCTNLKSVVLKGVETLNATFYECRNLESLILNDGLKSLAGINYICKLKKLNIPDSVEKVGSMSSFGSIETNTYGNGKYLGNEKNPYLVLLGISAKTITEIEIHQNTKVIAAETFKGCNSLGSVVIPDSVEYINRSAFENCSNLTTVTFGEKLRYIGSRTFWGCHSLQSITFKVTTGWKESNGNGKYTDVSWDVSDPQVAAKEIDRNAYNDFKREEQ